MYVIFRPVYARLRNNNKHRNRTKLRSEIYYDSKITPMIMYKSAERIERSRAVYRTHKPYYYLVRAHLAYKVFS